MYDYLILAHPGHNRVYFGESRRLCEAELSLAFPAAELSRETLGGAEYIALRRAEPMTARELDTLARMSCYFTAFLRRDGGLIEPLDCGFRRWMDDSVTTVLRYSGKTNELFTRTLVNIAALSGKFDINSRLNVLDPAAGKGTTLFEALTAGYDAAGIELSEKSVSEGCIYFAKYLETEKWKHTRHEERISGAGKSFTARKTEFTLAPDKDAMKTGNSRNFTLVCGDSAKAAQLFSHSSFHIIACDLPYGIQHANVTGGASPDRRIARSPLALVEACADGWRTLLKTGGAAALAWNSFVLSRAALSAALERHGLRVLSGGAYENFEHRVDNAIRRDVVVAVKD